MKAKLFCVSTFRKWLRNWGLVPTRAGNSTWLGSGGSIADTSIRDTGSHRISSILMSKKNQALKSEVPHASLRVNPW